MKKICINSGNDKIENIIQEMQLKIDNYYNIIFEWIPYNQFDNIKEIRKDGFVAIYLAIWKDGPLHYEEKEKIYKRKLYSNYKKVILKCLQNINNQFLKEV
jgi:hypothetical protein